MSFNELEAWPLFPNHEFSFSRYAPFEALSLVKRKEENGLYLKFEDNRFYYHFHYVANEDRPCTEVFAILETRKEHRFELISVIHQHIEHFPLFKASRSFLLTWSLQEIPQARFETVKHHIIATEDGFVEVLANRDPESWITDKLA
ncbi:hypothetical protein ACFO4L_01240 [Bacillus daqingensis]|uniref:Uncharacterized protein n=1 Tax=Bacillus daqingensis TaxID=872396 RepID=A0ABV9NT26_9BACI